MRGRLDTREAAVRNQHVEKNIITSNSVNQTNIGDCWNKTNKGHGDIYLVSVQFN